MQLIDIVLSSSWSSFVVLQLKESLEILQIVVERIECRCFSNCANALSTAKPLVLVAVTL